MKRILLIMVVAILALSACQKQKKMKAGQIRLTLLVYNDPKGNLFDSFKVPVSTLYFLDQDFLEVIPGRGSKGTGPLYALIRDSVFCPVKSLTAKDKTTEFYPVGEKPFGATFTNRKVPGYEGRNQLPDTLIGGLSFQRLEIRTSDDYSIYYVHPTDTVIPFSLAPQFDRDYQGILLRIDTYEFDRGRFLSLRMEFSEAMPHRFYTYLKNQR